EAGVPATLTNDLRPLGLLHTRRVEAEGLHDELLHVYRLVLPASFQPRNRDGEVSEFLWLEREEVLERLGEFSPDAAAVIAMDLP
ncbi:MAG TPA: NUDIX hydrolase, partial [Burkholderiaceae bacterium]